MRHTLRDVTFETPDELPDCSEYMHKSSDGTEVVRFRPLTGDTGDDAAVLAAARDHFEGTLGTQIVYSNPITFTRAGGASVPAHEGEWRDFASGRYRFALAAVVSSRGKAVALYSGPSRPNALRLFAQVLRQTFVFGERGADVRNVPARWTRRQADRMLFALPGDWTGPQSLVFRSDLELRVRLTEPAAPEGTIDLSNDLDPDNPETATKTRTEPVSAPDFSGWIGEWRLSGGARAPGDEKVVRKASFTLAGKTVVTAYGRCESAAAPRLTRVWDDWRRSVRAARETDG